MNVGDRVREARSPSQSREAQASLFTPELLAKLQPRLRQTQFLLVLGTLLKPFRSLIKRERWNWRTTLAHYGRYHFGESKGGIWIHAIATGQLRIAIVLVSALPKDRPVVITTFNPRLGQEALGERAKCVPVPFPFVFAFRGFLRHFSPRQLVLIESGDLDPLLRLHVMRREIPTAVINGWVSKDWLDQESGLLPLFKLVQILGVREEKDRELLAGVGVPREKVAVTGEMKFDVIAHLCPEIEAQMQKLAGERPILIAGSTYPAETPQILDAFERLGGGDRAMLILAPRIAYDETAKLLRNRNVGFVRRTRLPESGRPAIVLLDKLGELAALYRLAVAAFVGGSLWPRGRGHNPIEPARFAVPIAVGPYMASFQFHAALFDRAGAWQRVADAEGLARVWASWLDDPELARQMGRRAADLVESHRGLATAKTLELLRPFLSLQET